MEQRTDFDKLDPGRRDKVLQVSGHGTPLHPRDHTLVELFGLAREMNVDAEGIDIGPSPTDAFVAEQLGTPIEQLDMTVRSYNCLKREGIHTVGELITRSEADLLGHPQLWRRSPSTRSRSSWYGLGLGAQGQPARVRSGSTAVYFTDEDSDEDYEVLTQAPEVDDSAFAEDEQL